MCRIFEVSTSGYYEWLHNPGSTTKRENQAIYKALKASYDRNKGRAGLDKLLADVREKFPNVVVTAYIRFKRYINYIPYASGNSRRLRIPSTTIRWPRTC